MSGSATFVMLIAMVFVWGGLIASVIHLMRHPDIPLEDAKND